MTIRLYELEQQQKRWIGTKKNKLGRESLGIVEDQAGYLGTRLVLAGDANIGKTKLFKRFVNGEFRDKYEATIGVDDFRTKVTIADQNYKLQITDVSGDPQYSQIAQAYYKPAKVFICVYDITNEKSFENIQQLIQQQKTHNTNVRFILVGNKCDLVQQRQVSEETAAKVAREHGIPFLEVSALHNHNVNEIFTTALDPINYQKPSSDPFALANVNSDAFKKILETAYNTAFLPYNRIVSGRCCFFTSSARGVQQQKLQNIIATANSYDSFITQTLALKAEIHQDHLDNSYFARKGYTASALEGAIHDMLIVLAAQDEVFNKTFIALTSAKFITQIEQVKAPK